MSKDPEIYRKMVESIAPSLKGHDNEKEGCLLALFGAPEEIRPDITTRGTIHILLAGDPAVAKSDLMVGAIGIAPKGMITDARGSSAVGLTATVQKDENGKWRVIAGALVLANQGIVAVDELDKMRDEDRDILHRVMEQQEVTINKADIHNYILRARTSLLASANPILGKYDDSKSLAENLPKFPIPLLTRFDLIFIIRDITSKEEDINVIRAILSSPSEIQSPIDRTKLKRYIAYAKKFKPKLSMEVMKEIEERYVELREKSRVMENEKVLITPRQGWTLKRLTLAHARALLKTEADIDDFNAAKRLFDVFMSSVGSDVLMLETGMGAEERKSKGNARSLIIDTIREHTSHVHGTFISRSELEEIVMKKIDRETFNKIYIELMNEGTIYNPSPNYVALMKP
jgi:replicative DNA helicase Mcm